MIPGRFLDGLLLVCGGQVLRNLVGVVCVLVLSAGEWLETTLFQMRKHQSLS